MYLSEDYKGLCSGIVYAKKGDQVNVIRVEDNLTFVEFNGEKFHVRNEILSNKEIEADKEIIEPVIKHPISKRKTSKPVYKTQQLF